MKTRSLLPLLLCLLLPFLSSYRALAQTNRIAETGAELTPEGELVKYFTLQNRHGMQVRIMTYGAIITDIQVPDRQGKIGKVLVGNDTLTAYLRGFPAAAVIGRFANRIRNGRFTLDGQEYQVTANLRGGHHIHGGTRGFAKQIWTPEIKPTGKASASLKLSCHSADGEEGYPGNVVVSVTYTLNDDNELILDYEAATDRPTILNLTNHAYFDLSGNSDIANHELYLNADYYTLTDMDQIPTGEIAPVKDTPLDFTKVTLMGARMQEIEGPRPHIYDHNFIINNGGTGMVKAAEVYYPNTGRVMKVSTNMPGVQFFTGNKRGFCLETQQFPDAINHPHFPSPVLRPDRAFASRTVFAFSVR